ncbi:MAG: DUF973 family protein [Acidilobus sp.]
MSQASQALTGQLKEGSLWAFVSLLLGAVGSVIPLIGFLVAGAGAYLFLSKSKAKLESSLSELRSANMTTYDGSTWVRYIPYAIAVMALGDLILAVVSVMTLASMLSHATSGPGFIVAGIILRELGVALIALGAVAVLLASLFPGLEIFDLGSRLNDDILRVAGILIIVPFVNFVGWAILAAESDLLGQRLGKGAEQQAAGPTSVSVA